MSEQVYVVQVDAISGKGGNTFKKGETVKANQLLGNLEYKLKKGWLKPLQEEKPKDDSSSDHTVAEKVAEPPKVENPAPEPSVLDAVASAQVSEEEVEIKAYGDITVAELREELKDNPEFDSDMRKKALYDLYVKQSSVK